MNKANPDFTKPLIMGVLNVTPDSFSDGGEYYRPDAALARLNEMIKEGADIIDIGGESTRPDFQPVSLFKELARIRTAVDYAYTRKLTEKIWFSIDTYKAAVAEFALERNFAIVNDVTSLRGDGRMTDVLLRHRPYVVLMYSKDPTARTTRTLVEYKNVVDLIKEFLEERIGFLTRLGFPKEKIIIDPGMGLFVSQNPKYSFEIIDRLSELKELGCPILVGVSRKLFLGVSKDERDAASVSWSIKAIRNGAAIVRMHNVALMQRALDTNGGKTT